MKRLICLTLLVGCAEYEQPAGMGPTQAGPGANQAESANPAFGGAVVITPVPDPPIEGSIAFDLMSVVRAMEDTIAAIPAGEPQPLHQIEMMEASLKKLEPPDPERQIYDECVLITKTFRASATDGHTIDFASTVTKILALRAALRIRPDDPYAEPILIAFNVVDRIIAEPQHPDAAKRIMIAEQLLKSHSLDPKQLQLMHEFLNRIRNLVDTPTQTLLSETAKNSVALRRTLQLDPHRSVQLFKKYEKKYPL